MQAKTTVTVYGGNQLDQAREVEPRKLAEEFLRAVVRGYFKEPTGRGGEWAYRLWLTGEDGAHVTWDREDDDALMEGLIETITDERLVELGYRAALALAVWGES